MTSLRTTSQLRRCLLRSLIERVMIGVEEGPTDLRPTCLRETLSSCIWNEHSTMSARRWVSISTASRAVIIDFVCLIHDLNAVR